MADEKWAWDHDDKQWYVRLKFEAGIEQLEWRAEWYDDRAGFDTSSTELQKIDDFRKFGPRERMCPRAIEDKLIAHFQIVDPPWRRSVDPKVEQLFAAAKAGDVDKIRSLIASRVDINARGHEDTTALMFAAKSKHEEAALAILDAGADATLVDRGGFTALAWAAVFALPTLITALATRAPETIEVADGEGTTPLHRAVAIAATTAAAEALVAAGANVNAQDAKGRTSLMLAARAGFVKHLELLLAAHADPKLVDAGKRAAIHHAVEIRERDPLVDRLIAGGADVNAQDKYGMTALMMCAKGDASASTVKKLLDAGARVDLRGDGNYTPLMGAVAATTVSIETIRLLLAAGDDPNAMRTGSNSTVLMATASSSGDVEALRVLLEAGANLHAVSSKGQTPLHCAIYGSHQAAACFLIERGADPNAKDGEGRDAVATVWKNPMRDRMIKALHEAIERSQAFKR